MKLFFRYFLFFLLSVGSSGIMTLEAQSRKVQNAEAKAEKQKEKQKQAYLKAQEKDKQKHFKMQTPETKKRMKATRKNARRINDRNHEPFLKRLFHHNNRK